MIGAHDQQAVHRYTIHFPDHEPRESDPHYKDFDHLRRTLKADPKRWRCDIGTLRGDYSECDLHSPLELHHAHIEFALTNAVELKWLANAYPGVDTPEEVGAWVESAENLQVLCRFHHRGAGGVHNASHADFEAQIFVRGLIG